MTKSMFTPDALQRIVEQTLPGEFGLRLGQDCFVELKVSGPESIPAGTITSGNRAYNRGHD